MRENTERVRVADHTGDPAESRSVRWRTHRNVASLAGRSERTRSQEDEDHLFYRVFLFRLSAPAYTLNYPIIYFTINYVFHYLFSPKDKIY